MTEALLSGRPRERARQLSVALTEKYLFDPPRMHVHLMRVDRVRRVKNARVGPPASRPHSTVGGRARGGPRAQAAGDAMGREELLHSETGRDTLDRASTAFQDGWGEDSPRPRRSRRGSAMRGRGATSPVAATVLSAPLDRPPSAAHQNAHGGPHRTRTVRPRGSSPWRGQGACRKRAPASERWRPCGQRDVLPTADGPRAKPTAGPLEGGAGRAPWRTTGVSTRAVGKQNTE